MVFKWWSECYTSQYWALKKLIKCLFFQIPTELHSYAKNPHIEKNQFLLHILLNSKFLRYSLCIFRFRFYNQGFCPKFKIRTCLVFGSPQYRYLVSCITIKRLSSVQMILYSFHFRFWESKEGAKFFKLNSKDGARDFFTSWKEMKMAQMQRQVIFEIFQISRNWDSHLL